MSDLNTSGPQGGAGRPIREGHDQEIRTLIEQALADDERRRKLLELLTRHGIEWRYTAPDGSTLSSSPVGTPTEDTP